jgi:hypothetical protein
MRRWLILAAMILGLAACAGSGRLHTVAVVPERSDSLTLYVVRRRWHLDIGFAAADLTGPLVLVRDRFPGARFILFGFGDEAYLTSRRSRFVNTLTALLPGAGLMLVTGLRVSPEKAFGEAQVATLAVPSRSAADAERLIWKGFEAAEIPGSPPRPGPYAGSLYFSSAIKYSAIHTCNTWVAEVLQAAGLPIQPRGIVFADQVWQRLPRQDTPASERGRGG